jgi:DNA repair protein RadC
MCDSGDPQKARPYSDFPDGRAIPLRPGKNISIIRLQVVRDGTFPYPAKAVKSSSDAARIFQTFLKGVDREYFVALLLDGKNRPNALNVVSIGSLNFSVVHPREVFKPGVVSNAASLLFGHNHPSGDTSPSREDIESTRRLVKVGDLLGIKVLDHVIVGEEQYFSFADRGLIKSDGEGE